MEIIEVVKPYLRNFSRTSSGDIKASCPFHKKGMEQHPSFSMSMQPGKRGVFYCYTCHATGPLPHFLRKMGLAQTVVEKVSQELLIPVRKRYKPDRTGDSSFLPESILAAFYINPHPLCEDGFSSDLLERYGIGYDSQRYRYTFPLRDVDGRLIGVSGRATLPEDYPKYLYYSYKEFEIPEYVTPKKDFLWNLDRVYQSCVDGQTDTIYIAEGFKVCLWLIQHGYPNTIALIGSMMTKTQLEHLESLEADFVLALDNDEAGLDGAYSVGKKLLPLGRVHVVDPDLMDQKEASQLDDLDADDVAGVLDRVIAYSEYVQKMKRRSKWA